jgi:hypothetical protein
MIYAKHCPMIPAKYKRAICWKRCKYWNRKEKKCNVEVKEKNIAGPSVHAIRQMTVELDSRVTGQPVRVRKW